LKDNLTESSEVVKWKETGLRISECARLPDGQGLGNLDSLFWSEDLRLQSCEL